MANEILEKNSQQLRHWNLLAPLFFVSRMLTILILTSWINSPWFLITNAIVFQTYLTENAYGTAVHEDLYNALEQVRQ